MEKNKQLPFFLGILVIKILFVSFLYIATKNFWKIYRGFFHVNFNRTTDSTYEFLFQPYLGFDP
jgi:hypothetical protein